MGVGALLAVYCFRGSARYATVALFALATIWTASRGPILALFVVSIVLILLQSRSVGRAAVGTAVVSCFAFWLVANSELLADVGLLRLSETITAAREGSILALRSVGVRFDVDQQTIALILRKPLGVGVGGWSHYVPEAFCTHTIYFSNCGLRAVWFLVRLPLYRYSSSLSISEAQCLQALRSFSL